MCNPIRLVGDDQHNWPSEFAHKGRFVIARSADEVTRETLSSGPWKYSDTAPPWIRVVVDPRLDPGLLIFCEARTQQPN